MGWLSELFPSKSSIDGIISAGIKAGDSLVHTEEEKAALMERVQAWYIDMLGALKPFNLAMRMLALGVGFAWIVHLFISTGGYIAAFFICDAAAEACRLAEMSAAIDKKIEAQISPHFNTIIMFYFGAAATVSGISAYKGK